MAHEFKVGDKVTLKSGGPIMTVKGWMNINETYGVVWFDGKDTKRDSFPAAALKLSND